MTAQEAGNQELTEEAKGFLAWTFSSAAEMSGHKLPNTAKMAKRMDWSGVNGPITGPLEILPPPPPEVSFSIQVSGLEEEEWDQVRQSLEQNLVLEAPKPFVLSLQYKVS